MGQKISIDTSILLYLLEENKQYVSKARAVMLAVQSGKYQAVFSSIGLIEILTGPKKQGHYEMTARYREIITSFPNLTIGGMSEGIVEISSNLRAIYGISTPDAIHIATAMEAGARKFITNDKGLKKIKEISVELL